MIRTEKRTLQIAQKASIYQTIAGAIRAGNFRVALGYKCPEQPTTELW